MKIIANQYRPIRATKPAFSSCAQAAAVIGCAAPMQLAMMGCFASIIPLSILISARNRDKQTEMTKEAWVVKGDFTPSSKDYEIIKAAEQLLANVPIQSSINPKNFTQKHKYQTLQTKDYTIFKDHTIATDKPNRLLINDRNKLIFEYSYLKDQVGCRHEDMDDQNVLAEELKNCGDSRKPGSV